MNRAIRGMLGVGVLWLGALPAGAAVGTTENVPGATLLLPYFQVDVADPGGVTTLVSINNASATAVLARVSLWTDAGVRTATFSVYLTGYDVQTLNLRDVFGGVLPPTASDGQDPADTASPADGISNQGQLSQDINFASCTGILPPAPLPAAFVDHLRAAHSGQPSAVLGGQCAGLDHGDGVVRGYLLVDVVSACGPEGPGDPGYFGAGGTGIATNQNVLWGDYFLVDPTNNLAQGDALVSLEASGSDPRTSVSGAYTFYGSLLGGSAADNREPAGTTYATRYLSGGAFSGGTSLLVWRDLKAGTSQPTFACGSAPLALGQNQVLLFDEQENATEPAGLQPFPGASGRTPVGGSELPVPSPFGWMLLNLNGGTDPLYGEIRQGFVSAVMEAEGLFGVGFRGIALDNASAPRNEVVGATDQAPFLAGTTPADGAGNVGLADDLVLTFSEAVDVSGEWFRIVCGTSGTRMVSDTVVSGGPTVFTIDPLADFAPGETCAVTVFAGFVTDQDADDPPDGPTSNLGFGFTTSTDAAPAVTGTSPLDGATGVSPAATVTVDFSEAVNVTGGAFTLECPAGTPQGFSLSPPAPGGAGSFTLTPGASLPLGTLCAVTVVGTEVTDVDAVDPPDAMAGSFAFTFRIEGAPALVSGTATTFFAEGGGPVVVDGAIVVTDVDGQIASGTVSLAPRPDGLSELLGADTTGTGITASYDSGTGVLTLSGAGTVAEYQQVLRSVTYANAAGDPTIADRTVQIQVNDGTYASNTVSTTVMITDVNDPPSFVAGADQTVLEDAGPQTVNPWATAISPGPPDEAAQTVTFEVTGNTNPGLFAGGPAVSSAGVLSYTPAGHAFGAATISVRARDDGGTANGGVDVSASQDFLITVTPVNDVPSFTVGPDQTVLEGSGAQTVDPWATAISPGPANESGQAVTFEVTNNTNPGLFAAGPAVSPTGVLTYTPAADAFGSATISVRVMDDGGTADGGVDLSATQDFIITLTPVNDVPSFTGGPDLTVDEDAGAQTVDPWASGISAGPGEGGQALTFQVTDNTNPGLFAAGPAVSPTGVLTFTPAADAFGTATITLELMDDGGTANGGVDTSPTQTFDIVVESVNDAPSFTKGPDGTVNEDAGAQTANLWATAISAGPANESGQSVTFQVTGNTNPGLFSAAPAVSPAGTLTYTPAANAFGTATITLRVMDDGGTANGGVDVSPTQDFVITVNAVNDAPSFTKGADQAVFDNAGPVTVNPWATAISPGPANESGQTVAFQVTDNTAPGLFAAAPAVSSTGVLTFTPAIVPAGTSTATITLQAMDNGGTANGGVDTSPTQTFDIAITHVNVPPQPVASPLETFDTIGNTSFEFSAVQSVTPAVFVAGNLVANFTDPDGPSPLAVSGVVGCVDTTAPFVCPTANGGSVTVEASGTFVFTPLAGDAAASDTFQYQVTDGMTPSAARTVTLNRQQRVWYVKNDAPAAGLGRSGDPFDTLLEAETASGTGDTIYVFQGNGTTTGQANGIVLQTNQRLLGAGVALDVPVAVNGGPNPTVLLGAGTHPMIDDVDAGGVGVAAPNAGNGEIRGLNIAGTNRAIELTTSGANGGTVTIANDIVRAAGLEGVDVNAGGSVPLVLTFQNNEVTSTLNAFDARTTAVGAVLRLAFSANTLTSTAQGGVVIDGSAGGSLTVTGFANNAVSGTTAGTGLTVAAATFDQTPGGAFQTVAGGNTVVGASGNGVGGSGVVMTNVAGDLAFTDLDVFADNGAGLSVSGTGAVNVGAGTGTRVTVGAGVAVIVANGGPAVSLNNLTAALPLLSLTSTNTSTTGVSLTSVSDGTSNAVFSAGGGSSVTTAPGASGPAFGVSGGNAQITYPGTITNNSSSARAVSITGWSGDDPGDDLLLSGAIDENGAGILVNGNAGSRSITFSGGMDVDTTTGQGFAATSNTNTGGLHVTGINTVDSVSATALRVTNTTIGASGLTFRSISSGNNTAAADPGTGIVLDNTGSTGGLTVTGTGAADSGGVIQNTTSAGISLTNTRSPSLTRMKIQNTNGSGIDGTQVTNFTFANGTIDNSGTGLGAETANIAFNDTAAGTENNLSGTVTITGNTLTNAYYHGIDIFNFNGTITDANLSSNTITSTNSTATSKGSGIRFIAFGSAGTTASVTRATIADNVVSNFPSAAGIQAQGGNANAAGTGGFFGTPGNATDVIAITGNTVRGFSAANRMGTFAIAAVVNGRGQGNFDISGNGTVADPITNTFGTAISLGSFGFAVVSATISDNVIVANNTFGAQGIGAGTSQTFGAGETPSLTVTITNNTISQTDGNGILVTARDASGTLRAKIQGNTVAAPLAGNRNGIRVDSGNGVSGDEDVCLNVSGNTTAGVGLSPEGIGLRKQGTTAGTNNLALHGFGTSPANQAQTAAYVTSQNPGSASGTLIINGDNFNSPVCSFP